MPRTGVRRALFVHPDRRALGVVESALPWAAPTSDLMVAADVAGAVRALAARRFDVVISGRDVRSGAGQPFLDLVRTQWPQVARVRLCSLTRQEQAWQPLGGHRQLLQRPSLKQALVAALSRAFALPRLLEHPALLDLQGQLRSRPGVRIRLASVEQYNRLLAGGASSPLAAEVLGFSLARLQQQALLSARIARRLLSGAAAEQAFAAALLASAGRVALAMAFPGASSAGPVSHAEIAACLLAGWGVPRGITEAVAFHRRPSLLAPRGFQVVVAVHVAAVLTEEVLGAEADPSGEPPLDRRLLFQLGLDDRVGLWRRMAEEEANLPESAHCPAAAVTPATESRFAPI